MRSPLKLVALVALIALVGPGCATFATKTEYCVFRELSETHDIVELAHYYRRYTTEFPDGVYSEQVAAMRPEIEREIFMGAGEERGLLWLYIDTFPDGIYTLMARQKIAGIDAMIVYQAEQVQAEEQAKLQAIEEAEATRTAMLEAYMSAIRDWIGIAGLGPYGWSVKGLAEASPTFFDIWSTEPLATCAASSCTKHYEVDTWYSNEGGTRINRHLEMAVKIVFDGSGIIGFSLTWPGRGILPYLEEMNEAPFDFTQESLDVATLLVIDLMADAALAAMPGGEEAFEDETLWSWRSPRANLDLVRTYDPQEGVTDTLMVQLLPPPPPEPEEPVKKKKKKTKTEEVPGPPPLPLATPEMLMWVPPAPEPEAAAPAPVGGEAAPDAEAPPQEE